MGFGMMESHYPSRRLIKDTETGSHIVEEYPVDEFNKRMLVREFDDTIQHFAKNDREFAKAAFLADEKKRYEDNTY